MTKEESKSELLKQNKWPLVADLFDDSELYMPDNPVIMEKSDPRCLFISKYFNRLGSSKQLVYMDRTFFYKTLEKIKSKVLLVSTREQTNDDYFYNNNE